MEKDLTVRWTPVVKEHDRENMEKDSTVPWTSVVKEHDEAHHHYQLSDTVTKMPSAISMGQSRKLNLSLAKSRYLK